MGKKLNLIGKRFGRLLVIKEGPRKLRAKTNQTRITWACKCDCGSEHSADGSSLKKGSIVSCGCYHSDVISWATKIRNTTHGKSKTRTYRAWAEMMRRCYDENRPAFKNYGGRGIVVSVSWHKFENFYKDMSDPGPGKSLERINNSIGYSKSNCAWADKFSQANNRRNNTILIINKIPITMMMASKKFKIKYSTLRSRIKRGWDHERAVRSN